MSRRRQGASRSKHSSHFERRAARNRAVLLVMAVLMVLSLVAVPLTLLLAPGGA